MDGVGDVKYPPLTVPVVDFLQDSLHRFAAEDKQEGVWHLICADEALQVADFDTRVQDLLEELHAYDPAWDAVHLAFDTTQSNAEPIIWRSFHGARELRHVRRPLRVYGPLGLLVHGSQGARRMLRLVASDNFKDLNEIHEAMSDGLRMYMSSTPFVIGGAPYVSISKAIVSRQWGQPEVANLCARWPSWTDAAMQAPAVFSTKDLMRGVDDNDPVVQDEEIASMKGSRIDMFSRVPGVIALEEADKQTGMLKAKPHKHDGVEEEGFPSRHLSSTRNSHMVLSGLQLRQPLADGVKPVGDFIENDAALKSFLDSREREGGASLCMRRPAAAELAVGDEVFKDGGKGAQVLADLQDPRPTEQNGSTRRRVRSGRSAPATARSNKLMGRALDHAYNRVLWQALRLDHSHGDAEQSGDQLVPRPSDAHADGKFAVRFQSSRDTPATFDASRTTLSAPQLARQSPAVSATSQSVAARARMVAEQLRSNSKASGYVGQVCATSAERVEKMQMASTKETRMPSAHDQPDPLSVPGRWRAEFNVTDRGPLRPSVVRL